MQTSLGTVKKHMSGKRFIAAQGMPMATACHALPGIVAAAHHPRLLTLRAEMVQQI